ncbi:MAG: hypothetical protein ACYDAO_00215 [Thermoplasmataceae archaeon]
MSLELTFSNDVSSWTKLGTSEFFRILDDPADYEKDIQEYAKNHAISWDITNLRITGDTDQLLNDFLEYSGNWYTNNKLSLSTNYDLMLKKNDDTGELSISPITRPSTLKHIQTNASNYKPRIKPIDLDSQPQSIIDEIKKIKETEIFQDRSYSGLKQAKIWSTERHIEFKVIEKKGKKAICFGCGKSDILTLAKGTQYPVIVGLENYANFFSYHSGEIGFCRTCAISNHFAWMRVMYFSLGDMVFMGIPESNTVQELMEFLKVIEDIYKIARLNNELFEKHRRDRDILSDNAHQFSNFVDNPKKYSGFYYLILSLFMVLKEGINEMVREVNVNNSAFIPKNKKLIQILTGENIEADNEDFISIIYRSWSFILIKGDQIIRSWRYQGTTEFMEYLDEITSRIDKELDNGIKKFLGVISKLTYKSGSNFIDSERENFSRSLLYMNPAIDVLERYTWNRVFSTEASDRGIPYELQLITTVLGKYVLKGDEMENENLIKQCKSLGMKVAKLAKEDNSKSILYDLRSVGNSQALRAFIERLSFNAVLMKVELGISNEFLDAISDDKDWDKYKSIIAIVANQNYAYNSGKAKEVGQ